MSNQPYVTVNNDQKSAQGAVYAYGSTQTTTAKTSPYGAAAPTMNNSGLPYGAFPSYPSSTSSTTAHNPYQNNVPPASLSPTSNYGAAPVACPPTDSYNPYAKYGPAPNLLASSTGTNSTLPDFSKALAVQPPTGPSSNHGFSTSSPKPEVVATAFPVYGNQVTGLVNSTTYQGGPTNGLVSEGNPVKCHKVDYEIKGHEMQLVEIELDANETVIGEAGGMMFIEEGIKFEAKFGDGSEPKQGFWKNLLAAGGRLMTGESLFVTHFTNESQKKARVAFAAPYPGNIVPLNLANLGGSIICQRDAFLCAALGTKISMTFNKRIGSGLFGGEGFILQKMEGDGMAFVHAGGTIIKREMRNERIRLDTGCLVAFTPEISFDVQFAPGLKTALFGGEGLFLAVLQGTGTVWMQSLPFSRMADRIIQSAPSAGGRRVGEGSALTGRFGDLINGDGF